MNKHIIAWDLDETLGSWIELGVIWDAIKKTHDKTLTINDFFNLVNLFPEFIKPGTFTTLNMLKLKAQKDKNLKIILFTNNEGPQSWARYIVSYLNYSIRYELFTDIIPAYKINGRQIAKCRTSYEKLYSDLINCINVPDGTPVCFIDDQYHEGMDVKHVKYIYVEPFNLTISPQVVLTRLKNYKIAKNFLTPIVLRKISYILRSAHLDSHVYTRKMKANAFKESDNTRNIIRKFLQHSPSTRKNRKYVNNKTMKRY